MPHIKPTAKRFLLHLAASALGSVLFAASFPNPVIEKGLPVLAWIAYIPVFWLINDARPGASVFWGAVYGYAAYGLFNYWLGDFHALAGVISGIVNLVYAAVLFFVLKIAGMVFPRRGYLLQWALWVSYEYLRTLGFLGYSYGITGYSQWTMIPIIQIAGLFGVWGVSALVVFPSAFIAWALRQPSAFLKSEKPFAVLWGLAFLASLSYGILSPQDYSSRPSARFALIQHNTDPWKGGLAQYRKNFESLRRLSEEALAVEPEPDIVVWSETAFIPRIYWHKTYRGDQASYLLVKDLLDYLDSRETSFVIGNDDGRREVGEDGTWQRVDYNAVMLFEGGELVDQYRKMRLVPFTEHFPYKKQFPWVYDALENEDTHFWKPGGDITVFETRNIRFSSPICFEDTFGYISREFARAGAEVIVNLSNDAWSGSLSAQLQHLSMAVLRTVENRRAMVRATASGQTCAIAPNGAIIAMAPAFEEAALTVDVPLMTETTLYTRWGDYAGRLFLGLSLLALFIGFLLCLKNRRIKAGGKELSLEPKLKNGKEGRKR